MKKLIKVLAVMLALAFCIPSLAVSNTVIRGDANGDMRVNTGDAVFILRELTNNRRANDADMPSMDFNNDGKVNTGDAVAVLVNFARPKYVAKTYKPVFRSCCNTDSKWIADEWYFNSFLKNESGLIIVIQDMEALKAFVDPSGSKIEGVWEYLYANDTAASNTDLPKPVRYMQLEELTKSYSDEFFNENALAFVYLFENTESLYAQVAGIEVYGDTAVVTVNQYVGQYMCQVVGHKLFAIEAEKDLIKDITALKIAVNQIRVG
jgi:hypothetical protein